MTITYSQISQVLNKTFQEPLSDLIARSNPMLSALTKRAVASDKIYIKTRMASDHGAEPIADGSAVTLSGTEQTTYKSATLDWSTYISKFSVPKRLLAQVASNPGALGSLLTSEIEEAAKDLSNRIASDLWGGETPNGLVGMQVAISDSASYGGIARNPTTENWKSVVVDAENNEISTELLYRLDRKFFERNRYGFLERPQAFTGMTSAAFLAKYAALLTEVNIAVTSGNVPAIQANALNRGMLADFGSLIGFSGIPFVRNANVVPATGDDPGTARLYILDPSYWYLAVLESSPDAFVHQALGGQVAPVVDGIRAEIEILANTGEVVQGYVKTFVQLVCTDPAKGGTVLKNVKVEDTTP